MSAHKPVKKSKNAFQDAELDRAAEGILHLLYRRNPERFMVIYSRLKEDFEKQRNGKPLTTPQDRV
jgi:hypothetical protein